jgi:small GTP-binding protein
LVTIATIGTPFSFNTFKLSDGSLVAVNIQDTAGQEKFRALNESYYKKADCCLLVYDISNRASFEECKGYYNDNIKERCKPNIKVILLGNKSDLENKRQVPPEEAAGFALENDYIFMETSCLKNKNVADAFETLIEITNIEAKKNMNSNNNANNDKTGESNIKLEANSKKESKSGCPC